MKKTLQSLLRIIISGVIAFVILSVFCILYYNVPTQAVCEDGVSFNKWGSHVFYSRATEGFAAGVTNNDGYINSFDYEQGMPIDVLIMGSSHIEGFNTPQEYITSERLNDMLGYNGVYNIGVSGHSFMSCVNNMEAAVDKYKPSKYVVIEISTLNYSSDSINKAINGEIRGDSVSANGFLRLLQKNQYLRLLYMQASMYMEQNEKKQVSNQEASSDRLLITEEKTALFDALFAKISAIAQKYGAKAIIMYHPATSVGSDGSLVLPNNSETTDVFREYSEKNGVIFLDMSERFLKEYNENDILPHGFSNTSVGSGHLNRYGHEMIASELYMIISEVE